MYESVDKAVLKRIERSLANVCENLTAVESEIKDISSSMVSELQLLYLKEQIEQCYFELRRILILLQGGQ